MLQQKLPQQEQGFTMTEVLIAILITSLFVAASMQAMVYAAYFKVRARQYAEAATWIQQDLEAVRGQAAQLADAPSRCNATSSTTGFGSYLRDDLPPVPSDTTNASDPNGGTKTIAGKSFTLTRTSTVRDVAPYNLLQLTYSVARGSNPTVATIYTEVIPDAAFKCP